MYDKKGQQDISPPQLSSRQLHLSDLLRLLPWVPGRQVCDIGCGSGELAVQLADYGFEVTAVDVDKDIIQKAQQRYQHTTNPKWLQQDIRGFRMQREGYGLILCLNVFPFIPNGERARIIGRLKAALQAGGILIVSGLQSTDIWAQKKMARTSNQISSRPTGIFSSEEWAQRFGDWQTLWAFEGHVKVRGLDPDAPHKVTQRIFKKTGEPSKTTSSNILGTGLRLKGKQNLKTPQTADFLELNTSESGQIGQDKLLLYLAKHTPVSLYTQELSLGSPLPLPEKILDNLVRMTHRLSINTLKIELGFHGYQIPFLQALLPTEEALEMVKTHVRTLKARTHCQIKLEHIPLRIIPTHREMTEATFLKHIAVEAECQIGLRLSSVYGNAKAFNQSLKAYLEQLPEHLVTSLHIDLPKARILETDTQQLVETIIRRFPIQQITYTKLPETLLQNFFNSLHKKLSRP